MSSSTEGSGLVPSNPLTRSVELARVVRLAAIAFCGALPLILLAVLFADLYHSSSAAIDFRQFYRAAEAILDGHSPYGRADEPLTAWGGPYPYPPLPALVAVPLTALSLHAAEILVMAMLVLAVPAVLGVLDVRDWRCYGIVLLWPPVISAIQTGNVTLWFALAAALAWRFRDRVSPAAGALGVTLAAKFFLWPLVVWLAATRRWLAAAFSLAVGAGLLMLSWAVIGFAGFLDYPALLHKLDRAVGDDSYTVYNLGVELGLPTPVARAIWLTLGFVLLGAVVIAARRGDERRAFILAIAAALALTPIVWLHYFAMLVVVVALAQPRLGVVWLVPLGLIITPGSGHHTMLQLSVTLAVASLTVALALRASAGRDAPAAVPPPSGARSGPLPEAAR